MRIGKSASLAAAGILLLALTLVSSVAAFGDRPIFWPAKEFSSRAWKETEPRRRYVFYKSLTRSGGLMNMHQTEVEALLGVPDSRASNFPLISYTIREDVPGGKLFEMGLFFTPDGRVRHVSLSEPL